ncbi:MAG: hypothetical protein AB8H86_03155 [Polyangiales bacterium]
MSVLTQIRTTARSPRSFDMEIIQIHPDATVAAPDHEEDRLALTLLFIVDLILRRGHHGPLAQWVAEALGVASVEEMTLDVEAILRAWDPLIEDADVISHRPAAAEAWESDAPTTSLVEQGKVARLQLRVTLSTDIDCTPFAEGASMETSLDTAALGWL